MTEQVVAEPRPAARPRRTRPSDARAVRGGAGPRLRGPVLAADRAADPRMRRLRRAAAGDRLGRDDPRARRRRRWCSPAARPRSTSRGRRRSRPSCSTSRSRCWASVTGCRRWSWRSAAGSRRPSRASSAAPTSSSRDGGGRLLGGLPEEQSCWMSHRDAVFEPPRGLHRARLQPELAGRRLRDARPRPLRDPVPPRGRPHPLRDRDPHPLPARRRRLRAAVVAAVGDRRAGREDPGPGRGRAG